jgi:hypothetical protein
MAASMSPLHAVTGAGKEHTKGYLLTAVHSVATSNMRRAFSYLKTSLAFS